MRALAVWSALGGGAACTIVAAATVERMGGVQTTLDAVKATIASRGSPLAFLNPPGLAGLDRRAASAPEPVAPKPEAPKVDPLAPGFDVVRVERSGDAVIAGHAAPHASVELRDGATTLARTEADDAGQFVIVPDTLKPGDHALRLAAREKDGAELQSEATPIRVEPDVLAAVPKAIAKPTPSPALNPPVAPKLVAASPKASASPAPAVAADKTPAPSPSVTAAPPKAVASPEPSVAVARAPDKAPPPSPSVAAAPPKVAASPEPSAVKAPAVPSPTPSSALVASPEPGATVVRAPDPTPLPTPGVAASAAIRPPVETPSSPSIAAAPVVVAKAPEAGTEAAPRPAEPVSIAEAKPNSAGGFEAEGVAPPGAKIVLRLNGSYLAEVAANALGRWSLTVEHGLTAGLYALRAEAIDINGRTKAAGSATFAYAPSAVPAPPGNAAPEGKAPLVARPEPAAPLAVEAKPAEPIAIVTPPTLSSAPPAADDASHAVVAEIRTATVVKGDNLWDLARHYYGDGLRYSDIFHANSGLIHNPSLIYIGQVFVMPQNPAKTR